MAAVEPMDKLKECLHAGVEMLLDKQNDRLYEDMDGVDYLCVQLDRIQNLVERASGPYDIHLEIVDILRSAEDSLRSLATGTKESWVFNSTGCRGRPSFHIPQDQGRSQDFSKGGSQRLLTRLSCGPPRPYYLKTRTIDENNSQKNKF